MGNVLLTIIIVIVILMVVFLVLREVNCWYWKINERISLQQEQNLILKKILKELKNESFSQENQTGEQVVKGKEKVNISSSNLSDKTPKYKAPPHKIEKISQKTNLSNEKYLIVFDDSEEGYIYLNLSNKQAYFKGKPEGYWVNVKYMYENMDKCITALHYFLKTNKELQDGLIGKY